MDEWEDILERLEDCHAGQDGSPTELLRIIAELIDEFGELYADTQEARHALNAVALRLRNMICGDDEKLDQLFRQLTDLLSAWDYADRHGLPLPYVDAEDLEAMRDERDRLERTILEQEDRIAALEEELTQLKAACARPKAEARSAYEPRPRSAEPPRRTHDDYGSPEPVYAPGDPFREIPDYMVRTVDLGLSSMLPEDAPHLRITGTDGDGIRSYTFFNLPALRTVEFHCPVRRIDANAFYHEAELSLKFRNGACRIHPHAFSPGARIVAICAPRDAGEDSLEAYARDHRIPFFPL